MSTPVNLHLRLNEFTNLIRALEIAGILSLNQTNEASTEQPNALPLELTQAFLKLDFVANNGTIPVSTQKGQLLAFRDAVVKYAIVNSHFLFARTAQTAQADYLFAFLAFHDIYLFIGSKKYSLRRLFEERLPEGIRLPTSDECIRSCSFPAINELNELWVIRSNQAKEQQMIQARWLEYRAIHTFENIVLNLHTLSYALEGFINSNRIRLYTNNIAIDKPSLSPEFTQLLSQYAQLARTNVNSVEVQGQLTVAFGLMMKTLIANAKAPGIFQQASQQLLGFMLCHDFEVQHRHEKFRISHIVLAEMSDQDIQLWNKYGYKYLPFLNSEWLKDQFYPSKYDLECLLGLHYQELQKPVVPYFYQMSQNQQQQAAAEKMQIEPSRSWVFSY